MKLALYVYFNNNISDNALKLRIIEDCYLLPVKYSSKHIDIYPIFRSIIWMMLPNLNVPNVPNNNKKKIPTIYIQHTLTVHAV